jgi:WD40 repeat protein/uncharacterized caspase-like protein
MINNSYVKISSVISFLLFCLLLTFKSASQEPKIILPIGHTLGVASAVFSSDGKRMVTSALDNTAKIWDVETGQLLANLKGHTDTLFMANYSPDGKKIVTSCEDGTAKIWDANSTLLLADLIGHTDKVYTVKFTPDGKKIISTSADASVKIWDPVSGKLLFDLKDHTKAVWYAFFSPDGKKIITTSEDSTAKIWDIESGKLLADLKGHRFEVWAAEFSPDGKKVITGAGDSTAKIWDAVSGNLLKDIRDHKAQIGVVHFSPDGKKFVTASYDGDVKLWNAETGTIIANIKGKEILEIKEGDYYPDNIIAADFSPDGKKILTVCNFDSSVKVWDAFTGILLQDIKKDHEYVNSVSFSGDGKKFALALAYAHVEIRDMSTGTLSVDLKGGANFIRSFTYSPDGRRMLVSNEFGSAKLLDAENGTLIANFPGMENSKQGVSVRYSPDGKKVATIDGGNNVKVYDAITGIRLLELKDHKQKITFFQFSIDSKKIYTSGMDSTCKIWNALSGNLLSSLKLDKRIASMQLSDDGKTVITVSLNDNTAKIWNAETGLLKTELKGHTKTIYPPWFSPDGKKILTYSKDNTAKIWGAETGSNLIDIKETGVIKSAIFNADGKRIIISSEDSLTKNTAVKIWNAETGDLILDLKQSGISCSCNVTFSKDGKKMSVLVDDGTIKFVDIETGATLSEFKDLKSRQYTSGLNFSPDGKKAVLGADDGSVKIWEIETGKVLADLNEHTFFITSAIFSPDGKKIITISRDYTAKVWDAETGKSLYTFISVNKDDYLVTDKDNHFDGTEAARKLLYFTCGTEVIELEQVKDQLWVPNLAERILNGEIINAAKLSDLNICNLTPVVDTIGQTASHYRFRITPRLGGLGTTIVIVNGIEVKRYAPQQLQQQKSDYLLSVDKKELQKFFVTNKENSITVKSLTAKNSISSRPVSINEKGTEKSLTLPNLYAIVIGISDYKGEGLDLKFAAKDAMDIAAAIDASAKKLLNTDGKEHVFIYKVHTDAGRDKFPEKNSIKQLFTEVSSKALPNDILLIFFAGHGVLESLPAGQAGEKNQFYFLTADASNVTVSGALKNVGISTEELAEWIKPQVMKAQKRILIFDACNSGQAIKEMVSFNQAGQNLMAARNDDKGKQTKAIEKLNERSGMFILSASASDQKAYEMGKYNQGVLTYSLLRAIKEQPDILEDRQYLNISRWFNAAEKSVNELARETGARQQPQIVSTTNFNIGVVDEEVRNKIVLPFEKPMFTRSDFRNVDLRIDNIKLRTLVDKELDEIAGNSSGAFIMYSPEYDGANVYAISGDYTVTNDKVSVSIILTKGGTEIKSRFQINGVLSQPDIMAKSIVSAVIEALKEKH